MSGCPLTSTKAGLNWTTHFILASNQVHSLTLEQRTLNVGGNDHCMAGLQFNKTGSDQKENMLLFACGEAVEFKLGKLEISHTVILPPLVNVFWLELSCTYLGR